MSFLGKIPHSGGPQLMTLKPERGLQHICVVNSELCQWKYIEFCLRDVVTLFAPSLDISRALCGNKVYICALATLNSQPD